MRAYCPVVVRDNEAAGVQLWSFSKMIYQQLLNIMLDPDYGDITDPADGRDIKVTVIKKDGFKYPMVDSVMPRGKASDLNSDATTTKEWLGSIPDLNDILKNDLKTYEEVEKIVNDWVNGGAPSDSIGTTRFETSVSTSPAGSSAETTATTDENKTGYTDLDAAFDDLLS
jgi:hypothetical protein